MPSGIPNPPTPDGTKRCNTCGELLQIESFHNRKMSPDGKAYRCKKCSNEYNHHWLSIPGNKEKRNQQYKESKPKKDAQRRAGWLRRKYGLTWERYQEMIPGGCSLCGTHAPNGKRAWHVDHCHKTGVVRGILCHSCNTSLGHYEKLIDVVGLEAITKYLSPDVM